MDAVWIYFRLGAAEEVKSAAHTHPVQLRRILLLCLLPAAAMAELVCALGPNASSYQPSADQRPSSDVMVLAKQVNAAEKTICASTCPEIQVLRNSTAPNIILTVRAPNAKLVYAPPFFAALYASYGDAGIIAIMAHELGHALDDTMGAVWIKSGWSPELRADAWAGCTLARANLGRSDMLAALAALEKYPPVSHPSWNTRISAIGSGYTHCGGDPSVLKRPAK